MTKHALWAAAAALLIVAGSSGCCLWHHHGCGPCGGGCGGCESCGGGCCGTCGGGYGGCGGHGTGSQYTSWYGTGYPSLRRLLRRLHRLLQRLPSALLPGGAVGHFPLLPSGNLRLRLPRLRRILFLRLVLLPAHARSVRLLRQFLWMCTVFALPSVAAALWFDALRPTDGALRRRRASRLGDAGAAGRQCAPTAWNASAAVWRTTATRFAMSRTIAFRPRPSKQIRRPFLLRTCK